MTAFDTAWALLKMPMYHATNRKNAEKIMQEGLKPTSSFNYDNALRHYFERLLQWGEPHIDSLEAMRDKNYYSRQPIEHTIEQLEEARQKDRENMQMGVTYAYNDKMPRKKDNIGGKEYGILEAFGYGESGDIDYDEIDNPIVILEIDDFPSLGWGLKPPHYELPPEVSLTNQTIPPKHIRILPQDEIDVALERYGRWEDDYWRDNSQ